MGHSNNKQIYVLTLQDKSYGKLDDTKILGLAQVSEEYDKYIFLDYLQANPDIIYSPKRKYKGIGTGILNSLKQLYDEISLAALNEESVRHFYRKNHFRESLFVANDFNWKQNLWGKIKQFFSHRNKV